MENVSGVGIMTIFFVSGSVAFVALQLHKRLLSDFMKKIESEFGCEEGSIHIGCENYERELKKKVRFAEDVIEPSSDNKQYRKRRSMMARK